MMRKTIVLVLALCILLCGCVSRESYEQLERERDALREQVEALTEQVASLQGDISELQAYAMELYEEKERLSEALETAESVGREQSEQLERIKGELENFKQQAMSILPNGLPSGVSGVAGTVTEAAQNAWNTLSGLLGQTGKK